MHLEARILNPIAKTQKMATDWGKTLFSMNQADLDAADLAQYKALLASGVDQPVAMAYQMTAPLLTENEAISNYITRTGNSRLRAVLPELTTIEEAIELAIAEYRLTRPQTVTLKKMLQRLNPSASRSSEPNKPRAAGIAAQSGDRAYLDEAPPLQLPALREDAPFAEHSVRAVGRGRTTYGVIIAESKSQRIEADPDSINALASEPACKESKATNMMPKSLKNLAALPVERRNKIVSLVARRLALDAMMARAGISDSPDKPTPKQPQSTPSNNNPKKT